MNSAVFIVIAVFTLAAALAAATLPNLMHAALCLVLALLGVAHSSSCWAQNSSDLSRCSFMSAQSPC